jgi:hypothetical protein
LTKTIAFSLALLLFSVASPAHAALKAQAQGWGYQTVDAGSLMSYMLGQDTKAMLVKIPSSPEQQTPAIRIMDVKGDASKLAGDIEAWRGVILNKLVSKPAIINERILTIHGQQRYYIEFQTDTGTESMLQTSVMAFVMNGKIYKLLYENRQAIYRTEIVDVRKAFEAVKLSVE